MTARASKKKKSATGKWQRDATQGEVAESWRIQDAAATSKTPITLREVIVSLPFLYPVFPASNGVQLRADTFLRHSQEDGEEEERVRE